MTPELLRSAGEALYGASWRAPLARDLGVSDRTIQRWLRGEYHIPQAIRLEIHSICIKHSGQLEFIVEII